MSAIPECLLFIATEQILQLNSGILSVSSLVVIHSSIIDLITVFATFPGCVCTAVKVELELGAIRNTNTRSVALAILFWLVEVSLCGHLHTQ
jgi:hypothetical protein